MSHLNGHQSTPPQDEIPPMHLVEQAQTFFRRITATDKYELSEGYPQVGSLTPYAQKVAEAYASAYAETQDKDTATRAAGRKYKDFIQLDPEFLKLLSASYPRIETPVPEPVKPLVPDLLKKAHVDYTLGNDVCDGWFDRVVDWCMQWATVSDKRQVEGMVLWAMSTVAARRILLHHIKPTYTPLIIALVAPSSIYAKSTPLAIIEDLIERAGLSYLLLGTDPTPPAFWRRLSGIVPDAYEKLQGEAREEIEYSLRFSAQKGWVFDEFGLRLSSMLNDNSPYADFHRIFRAIDDCKERYAPETITRGATIVKKPYLALLASMTPDDMRKHAKRGAGIWGDGLLGRFILLYPRKEEEPPYQRPPLGERIVPAEFSLALSRWHHRLGIPDIELRKVDNEWTYAPVVLPRNELHFGEGTRDAVLNYYEAMRKMAWEYNNNDFNASYLRFPEKALRVAMLFASFEGSPTVDMRHWARAQRMSEEWRINLHDLYAELNTPPPSERFETEEAIMRQFAKALANPEKQGWLTPRDLQGPCHIDTVTARKWCEDLFIQGDLDREETQRSGSYRYARPGTPKYAKQEKK